MVQMVHWVDMTILWSSSEQQRNGRNRNICISITDIANQTVLCVMYMIVKAGTAPNPLDTGDDISVGGEYCLVLLQLDKSFHRHHQINENRK